MEFLGKLAVPLLNIRNGEKRWYALKDKKMRARAKGNYPQILLEMTVIWNQVSCWFIGESLQVFPRVLSGLKLHLTISSGRLRGCHNKQEIGSGILLRDRIETNY